MSSNWPLGKRKLKLGILGMTEGNGHPYSWSAIFNHYDRTYMDQCPYPGIAAYLNKQPRDTFGIDGAHVTHIYCNDRKDAEDVARCALIPHVVDRPEDMIGAVDAVICATDIGSEHVDRCRPFIEADIPLFIDKPLVDREEDLQTFVGWHEAGKRFLSSSSLRYLKAMEPYHQNHHELGRLVYICQPMVKKWETYGIHALEGVYPLLGPGFVSVQNTGTDGRDMVHITHASGCDVHIPLAPAMAGASSHHMLFGTEGCRIITDTDTFYAFKKQLVVFVDYLRSGQEPYPFAETIELMKLLIGALTSRQEGGRKVLLTEIKER